MNSFVTRLNVGKLAGCTANRLLNEATPTKSTMRRRSNQQQQANKPGSDGKKGILQNNKSLYTAGSNTATVHHTVDSIGTTQTEISDAITALRCKCTVGGGFSEPTTSSSAFVRHQNTYPASVYLPDGEGTHFDKVRDFNN